jgi:putative protease
MRNYKGKPLELLAPAGNFEIFKSIVTSKCDAIYFGGQTLNMRLIRKGFNFSDRELAEAVEMAHQYGKKAYITVNNLMDFDEIEEAKTYLKMLEAIQPDAIIVQDFAVLELVRRLNLSLEIHASVMMNVHNSPMVEALQHHGVSRVVLSREASLEDVRRIHARTQMEIEYFTHGDMCIAHGAQCYYSSMLFGMSSNRGKCLKPCRWWFSTSENAEGTSFPLAVKDLCLYPYLPEMIDAGVTSFKIEGRMREKAFITTLIDLYGDALDRYIEDPENYDRVKNYDLIVNARKRDFSTAYAFGKPGAENINTRHEGTGKLYSSGKMFSTPTAEKSLTPELVEQVRAALKTDLLKADTLVKLSVRVSTFEQAMTAIEEGVDRLYLAADVFLPKAPMTLDQIAALRTRINSISGRRTELYAATPRMMADAQFDAYLPWLLSIKPFIDGLLIGNLGALQAFKSLGLDMAGDFSLNVFNPLSAAFYLNEGLSQVTGSLELNARQLKKLCEACSQLEVVAHGRLSAMYFEHDFYEALQVREDEHLRLYNEAGVYDLYKDQHQRNHLLTTHIFTMLPVLEQLMALKPKMVRIEGQTETSEALKAVIRKFNLVLTGAATQDEIMKTMELAQHTFLALPF